MVSPHAVSSPSQFIGLRVASSPRSAAAAAASLSPRPTLIAAALRSPGVSPPRPAAASFYEVLGVPAGASDREIKAAYRRLALVCHPDVGVESADEFMLVHAAYSTLSDHDKRADYDRQMTLLDHRRRQWRPSHSVSPSSFKWSRVRTWETDQCW